ncbi:hypothetical protein QFC21_005997 [Naganishia friedmannii]|uniref:Uncharacterized protein n=1 Tax=Naganishia friedmannii TaxID=89922 RepID=A0ACC2V5S1_9TREE|nr:hypothetical protein QFC21_005997 [Naganishia friedmannii]
MTRTTHHSHPTPAFPVFCMAFTDDESLLLGGGGGASRTGIVNKLKLFAVDKGGKKFEGVKEYIFEKGADSPNTLAVDPSKHTVLNASNSLLAIAATNYDGTFSAVTVFTYPDLEVVEKDVLRSKGGSGGEVVDLDWSGDGAWLAITTPSGIDLYSVSLPKSTELADEKSTTAEAMSDITFRQTILPPSLDLNPVVFRSARFARTQPLPVGSSSQISATLHCILNSKSQPKTRSRSSGKRAQSTEKAFACNLSLVKPKPSPVADRADRTGEKDDVAEPKGSDDKAVDQELGKWDVVARRDVGNKPVTALELSTDGKLLAYASSDLSIGILDARTLTPLLKILHAHSFPTTALAFNPSGTLLASSSADNTVRLIVVPESFGSSSTMILSLVIALLLLLIALYIQYKV